MADNRENLDVTRQLLELELQRLENAETLKGQFENHTKDLKTLLNQQQKIKMLDVQLVVNKQKILDLEKEILKAVAEQNTDNEKNYRDQQKALANKITLYEQEKKQLRSIGALTMAVGNSLGKWNDSLGNLVGYLNESDKAIKGLNLSMGLSGDNADRMRDSINESAGYAGRMGVTVAGLAEAQADFADQTGRVGRLSAESLQSIVKMGQGSALGMKGATEMAANMELVGYSAEETAGFVEDIQQRSQQMGLNAGKVVKSINANFKQAQKFNFKEGAKGLGEMAMHAQKFKIDMDGVFNSAKQSRTLEGSIKMAAELQVMGGRFASYDPMKMLNLSRNNLKEYQKEMNSMLKGLSTFDSKTGKFGITPEDQDRLEAVAQASGQNVDNLIEQAHRMAEISKMQGSLAGKNAEQKETLEALAKFNKEKGVFEVTVGDEVKDIRSLTDGQIKALQTQKATLEQQAIASQDMDTMFKNTILELKSSLLPILKYISKYLVWVDETTEKLKSLFGGKGDFVASIGKLALVGGPLLLFTGKLGAVLGNLKAVGQMGAAVGGGLKDKVMGMMGGGAGKAGGGAGGGIGSKVMSMFKGGSSAMPGADTGKMADGLNKIPGKADLMGKAAGMAAIGVAAAGIGAGIWMASEGIAKMAKAFEGESGWKSVGIIAATLVGFGVAIAIAGTAASVGAVPLLAVGAAALMMGAGIGIATAGIGYMAEGLSKLTDPAIAANLLGLGMGITGIAAGSMLLGNPLSLLGLGALSMFMDSMTQGVDFGKMDQAFANAKGFMEAPSGNLDKMHALINAIASADTEVFAQMKDALSGGLEVRFADQEVALNVNVTAQMDSDVVARSTASKMLRVVKKRGEGKG